MARTPQLLDRWGNPIKRRVLTEEVSAATLGSVRSPISGTPADGLNPLRLASILRDADQGDATRYLELAEVIEERDSHYIGVLGTRRRSVSQIDITVEAASDEARDIEMADMIRDWLKRDELCDELFDILDCIGKGVSFTEIIWDSSEGQWMPERLEWRDPRWFRFDRGDLRTPLMLGDDGMELPLPGFKFIFSQIKAKSGLPLRSGLARVAAWGWMFKAYTQRDWAIFTQTYGQPLRVGKFGPEASEEDKETLFRAVANIAGDCAAIVPEAMTIDFIEAKNVGAASGLYKERADWLDQQISKAVLGQTATTDSVTGGLGSGKEHREVQEDIEKADAKALAAILNRDLIRPWIDLEYGPQKAYPRIVIARPEAEDLTEIASQLGTLVPLGLKVSMAEVRQKFGWSDPAEDDEILAPAAQEPVETPPQTEVGGRQTDATDPESAVKYPLKGLEPEERPETALQAEGASEGRSEPLSNDEILADRLADDARPAMRALLEQVEAMLAASSSFEEFREHLTSAYPDLDASDLAEVMREAMSAAMLGGMVEVAEASDG